jgi:hypothetical protein
MTSKRNDAVTEVGKAARGLAAAVGALVETAFPRDVPKSVPDDGIDVSYAESAKIVVVTDVSGKVICVRYGAIELPFMVTTGAGPFTDHQSAIVSMRLRRRPS